MRASFALCFRSPGRTLFEYQVRCAAAAGAAPIVVLVERVPPALHEAIERLRMDGLPVIPVSDGNEAASRFEAGSLILLVGDGFAAPAELLAQLAEEPEPAVATVPDDEPHEDYERIDASSRWAGVALDRRPHAGRDGGDAWRLGPSIDFAPAGVAGWRAAGAGGGDGRAAAGGKRRATEQFRARIDRVIARGAERLGEPLRASGGRGIRHRAAARYASPSAMADVGRADADRGGGIRLYCAAGSGRHSALLVVSAPLDLVARRLATLRLRPLPPRSLSARLLWPAAGLALARARLAAGAQRRGLGSSRHGVCGPSPSPKPRGSSSGTVRSRGKCGYSRRRNAILAAVPFAIAGAWAFYLVALALYAAGSFFYVQHWHHRITSD